jgi:methionine sulfoxide reductase heme-binding subunit
MKNTRFTPLQIIIHIGAWLPLILLTIALFTGRLGVNPLQFLEQRTGRVAITLLVLTLACTPLFKVFGWRETIKRRRTLGLYTFLYAAIHAILFLGVDLGLNWQFIKIEIFEKRYIQVGAIAFFLLFLMALTSYKYWMKRLKKNWKRLHRSIYLIAPLVVLHYGWAKKGDLFQLQGDVLRPFIYGLIVLLLLSLRIPFVRDTLAGLRHRLSGT